MSDDKPEYRTFVGKVVFPRDVTNYPYTRKAGEKTIYSYMFSVPALNGTDKLIDLEFWEGTKIPDCLVDKAALMVTGKYAPGRTYTKDGEERQGKPAVQPNAIWDLGRNVMEAREFAPAKPAVRKRPTPAEADIDLDF